MITNYPTQNYSCARLNSNIQYWITGPEDAPLIIFTHGATLDHHMFDPQIPAVTAAGYRMLTWDMRGHGQSKPMGETFSLQTAVDDLLTIIDELGYESAVLIGHSFGGFVSQDVTFRHPERVEALGVIGCTDLAAKPSRVISIASKVLPYLLPKFSVESFRKRTVEHVSLSDKVKQYAYNATGQLSKDEFIAIIMAGIACLAADSGYGDQYTIPKPFLLTHGEYDKANKGIFPKTAPAWAKKEPRCSYKVIPRAGHTANQDNPEAFNTVLLNFLRENVPL